MRSACLTTIAWRATSGGMTAGAKLDSIRGAASEASASIKKWLGTKWLVCRNQKADIRFKTNPLLGMPVGRTTSKADMRSVATISRRPGPTW